MQAYRLMSLAGIFGATLALSACGGEGLDLSTPSAVHTGKIQVKEEIVSEALPATLVNQPQVAVTARHVLRGGGREASLTIPYMPGRAKTAESIGYAYRNAFASEGVSRLDITLLPVTEGRYADTAIVTYPAPVAIADPSCKRIPGYQGADSIHGAEGYAFGCEVQSAEAKMIADPSDLLGKASAQDNNSRRSGTMIEPYLAGTPNQELKGMQASKVGQ